MSGFTGDPTSGCNQISDPGSGSLDPASLTTRLCGNGQRNPCDVNAECIVERDGSLSCVVRCLDKCKCCGLVWDRVGML